MELDGKRNREKLAVAGRRQHCIHARHAYLKKAPFPLDRSIRFTIAAQEFLLEWRTTTTTTTHGHATACCVRAPTRSFSSAAWPLVRCGVPRHAAMHAGGARARACMHASCPLVHMQVQACTYAAAAGRHGAHTTTTRPPQQQGYAARPATLCRLSLSKDNFCAPWL